MSGKTITASVGRGGPNIPTDVALVQYLLNCVPVSHAGPNKELELDGFAGVKTLQAISQFQKVHFSWSDGRVDPEKLGGVTFSELKKYDPLPFSAPVIIPNYKSETPVFYDGQVIGKKHSGVRGKKFSGGPGRRATAAELLVETPLFIPRGKWIGKKHSGILK